jgi:hypothetical protein
MRSDLCSKDENMSLLLIFSCSLSTYYVAYVAIRIMKMGIVMIHCTYSILSKTVYSILSVLSTTNLLLL